METPYGFDAAKLRAARTVAGASVARIARAAGVTQRAVSLYLAGSRVPRPEVLPPLAAAVGTTPDGLCTVEDELLAHLRVFTGRGRAAMARELGMAEETYRQWEITGRRGRLTSGRYDHTRDRWIAWPDWAAPVFHVTADRLAAAEHRTQAHWRTERDRSWQRFRAADPERAAMIEGIGRSLRGQAPDR